MAGRLLRLLPEHSHHHGALARHRDESARAIPALLLRRISQIGPRRCLTCGSRTLGRPTASINSAIRTNRARMSAGKVASSASTVSFRVSTAQAMGTNYTRYGIHTSTREGQAERRKPSMRFMKVTTWFQLANVWFTKIRRISARRHLRASVPVRWPLHSDAPRLPRARSEVERQPCDHARSSKPVCATRRPNAAGPRVGKTLHSARSALTGSIRLAWRASPTGGKRGLTSLASRPWWARSAAPPRRAPREPTANLAVDLARPWPRYHDARRLLVEPPRP